MNPKSAEVPGKVSVCMITYNHEFYIAKAIEGVLIQKTDFPVELVIGEDISTDATRSICKDYENRFPDRIKLLDTTVNLGIQRNFMETIKACDGEFVALCEGDDYWTDPYKLQKQVDFLRMNDEYTICHHRVEYVDGDGASTGSLSPRYPETTTFEDLARKQHILTPSCIFRNHLFTFPDFFLEVYGTDYALDLLNSNHGKIKYIDEIMGAYRIHGEGAWGGWTSLDRIPKILDTVSKCRNHFYPRASAEFDFHYERVSCYLHYERKEFVDFRVRVRLLFRKFGRFLSWRDYFSLTVKSVLSYCQRFT